ncbi:hypothetical protein [Lysobacter fragariae]
MSGHHKLEPGGVATFSTRPVGLSTKLFIEGGDHDSEAVWHIELCCKPDNTLVVDPKSQTTIDVSAAAGALVSVRNDGWASFTTWTDY